MIGDLIFKSGASSYAFTPAVARQGECMIFCVEVLQVEGTGSPSLSVTFQEKNRADTSWTDISGALTITTVSVNSKTITGSKELIRAKLILSSTVASDYMRVFLNPPVTRP